MGNSCGSCHPCCPESPSPHRTDPPKPHVYPGGIINPPMQCIPQQTASPLHATPRPLSTDPEGQTFQKIRDADIIDASELNPLIQYIEDLLSRIKADEQSPASTSASHGGAPGIEESFNPKFTSTIMEKISLEVERVFGKSKDASMTKEEIKRVAERVVDAAGKLHWMAVGFSVLAFVLERIHQVSANFKECIRLLEDMIHLAKGLQKLNESMPGETENIRRFVKTIVEGATTCCCSMLRGKVYSFVVADALHASLAQIRQEIKDTYRRVQFMISTNTYNEIPHRLLPKQDDLLCDIKSAVGMDDQVAKVTKLLEMEGSRAARAVIIYGFGGVGKSTLAKAVVSKLNLAENYKLSVVIIPENPKIRRLQENIIFDLSGKNVKLTDDEQGRRKIDDVLKMQSSFIFVDNVVNKAHIRDLLPKNLSDENPQKESEGNKRLRILVTSRESNVKQELHISCEEYQVQTLSDEAAKEFFSKSLCQSHDMPTHGIEERESAQIDRIAKACCGIPLLLEVFRKHLMYNRNPEAYDEALEALNKGLDFGRYKEENLSGIVLHVYETMKNDDAKRAFLDICVYLHASNRTVVSFIVDEMQLKVLEEAALVKNISGKVIVHDVLRAMGKKKAEGTRLRSHKDLERVLRDREKLKHIEGVLLDDNELMFSLQAEDLNAMQDSLRILALGDRINIDGQCSATFQKLRFLQVDDLHSFPFKDVSNLEHLTVLCDASTCSLRCLQLPPNLKSINLASPSGMFVAPPNIKWRNTKDLRNLRKFKFQNFKLRAFPEQFLLPTSLEELDLSGSLELRELPKGLRDLTKLEQLSLEGCRNLTVLPDQLFSKLSSLKSLSMRRCENLTKLPEHFCQLSLLENLDLSYCGNLQELPREFGQLSSLKILRLTYCESLREIPDLGMIANSLQELDIRGCKSLKGLPQGFEKLLLLQSLELSDLKCLIDLPESIGSMPSLTELKLRRCDSLSALPCSIGNLSSLKTLEISDCAKLGALPKEIVQLTSLKEMTLEYCESLMELPGGFGGMSLESLFILHCESLSKLPNGFGQLKFLVCLRLFKCVKLESLPFDFEGLSSLRYLDLEGCRMLESETMKEVLKLEGLCMVDITGCDKLRKQWKQMRDEEEYHLVVIEEESEYEFQVQRAVGVRLMDGQCQLNDCSGHSLVSCDAIQPSTTVGFLLVRSDSTSGEFDSPRSLKDGVKIISVEEADLYSFINTNGAQNNLPEGFHAIPSADIKSRTLLTLLFQAFETDLSILYGDVRSNEEGRKYFHVDKNALIETSTSEKEEDTDKDVSSEVLQDPSEVSHDPTNFGEARCISTISQFTNQLEMNGIEYFIAKDGTEVKVGSKLNAVFICEPKSFGIFSLLKLYTDLQGNFPDFQVVWMPGSKGWSGSLGKYERGRACMTWLTLPDPTLPIAELQSYSDAILSDEGTIQGEDMKLVLRSGAEAYPFSKAKLEEMKEKELNSLQHQPGMEFVLGECSLLNSSGEKVKKESLRGKVALLYAGCRDMQFESKLKCVVRKLKKNHADKFEIVYIGCNHPNHYYYDLKDKALRHLHMPEDMPWLRLSDMPTFWCRYGSLDYGSNSHLERDSNWPTIRRLLSRLNYNREFDKSSKKWIPGGEKHSPSVLIILDGEGMVLTGRGKEVVESLTRSDNLDTEQEETTRKEMIESMRMGYFTGKTKNKFRDEIIHPMHPEHPLIQWNHYHLSRICDICGRHSYSGSSNSDVAYICAFCDWDLCGACSAKLIQQ